MKEIQHKHNWYLLKKQKELNKWNGENIQRYNLRKCTRNKVRFEYIDWKDTFPWENWHRMINTKTYTGERTNLQRWRNNYLSGKNIKLVKEENIGWLQSYLQKQWSYGYKVFWETKNYPISIYPVKLSFKNKGKRQNIFKHAIFKKDNY